MKVMVAGSHFSPAQAVIEELLQTEDVEIVYLGRKYTRDDDSAKSPESQIFPKMGVKFIPITAGKLNRFFSIGSVISFLKTPVGFIQSFYYILKEQPDLIISFGGFTGLPVVVCGYLLSVPVLIHEQGLRLGLSNLISAIFADKVAVSFKSFKIPAYLNPYKFTVTGNPVRKEFLEKNVKPDGGVAKFIKNLKPSTPLILVTAGNQGSHKINLLVEDTLTELVKTSAVIHQTGDSKFADFDNLKKHESKNYLVKKWVSAADLSFILDRADMAVTRAGINTLVELSLKSVPSLIVPLPVGSEQKENARYFSGLGLGETAEEKSLTPASFLERVSAILGIQKTAREKAESVKQEILLNAEKRISQEALILLDFKEHPELEFRS
jgi:UDP-N-acetylglucosamine--N-acetylmuramyl-(pentapeptide) pyrophosphoryl-undecaprenol N-acetylglucosamine transferase